MIFGQSGFWSFGLLTPTYTTHPRAFVGVSGYAQDTIADRDHVVLRSGVGVMSQLDGKS